ncbi:MAG: transporter [Caldilineaceae bacterium]|nr:transporter [Caldilineaceae bacterium]
MIQLLVEEPLLLLFLVTAIGYAIGRIKIKGSSLGVAAVLFVGLFFGALNEEIELPSVIFEMGLVIFVYTIGLSSGAGFFASFNRRGLRDNLFIVSMLTLGAGMTAAAQVLLRLKASVAAGMFAGSMTNTPALAGLLDAIRNSAPDAQLTQLLAEPVVGYSVAYPMGVLGMLLAVAVMQRVWRIDYAEDVKRLRHLNLVEKEIYNRTVYVTNPNVTGIPLRAVTGHEHLTILLGRYRRDGLTRLADGDTRLQIGDLVSVIGTPEDVDAAVGVLGELTSEHLELDRSQYDFRRVFVSNPDVAGRTIASLQLPRTYDAVVTRVRRGDVDILADANTVLELGDRVRVVTRRENMPALSALFGDSYKALSEVNLLNFGIGLSLGMLLGLIPFPLPGGITFKLGMAGGPLIVGLVLGALRRTGPMVWTMSYSANLTLRQMGLILLLAGIGVRSGYTFVSTFQQSGGLSIFAAGAVITTTVAFLTLFIGYKLLNIPYSMLIGMLSGLQTQPAVLGFSTEQSRNEVPNIGYALVFPIATITKILFAQLLLILLR